MASLTPVAWMIGVGLASWAAVVLFIGSAVQPEAAYALAAPLVCVVGSWMVTARVHATAPSRVTAVMVVAFGVKAIVFAAYVVGALRGLGLRPVPFVASFTGFFVTLYGVEAYFLRRLFTAERGAPA